jgi:hypothetical protein
MEGGIAVAPASFGRVAPGDTSGPVFAIGPDDSVVTLVVSGLPRGGDIGVESAGFVPPGFSADDAAYLADPFSRGNRHPGTDSIMRLPGQELISAGVRAGDLLVATEASAPDHRRALRQLLHREIHRRRPCHHPRRRAHRFHQRRALAPLSGRSRRWSRRPPRGCSAGSGCGLSPAGRNAVPQVDYGGEVAGQDDGALLRCGVWRAGAGTLLHAPAMVNSARAADAAWMLSRAGRRRPVMRHPQPRYASAVPASASGSAGPSAALTRRRPPEVRLGVSFRAACSSAATSNATIASATASGARLGR